ncbi:MAG TPA: Ig-like domain-containing protein, partial [Steroidobacteraceae bacterium]|nr:Ig-like domain-containing protein [Steroidobacteraceae bacterium]
MRKTGILSALLALALTACGGADDSFVGGTGGTGGTGGGGTTTATPASLSLSASANSIPADGSVTAEIRALVRDSNNVVIGSVPVTLSSSSGALSAGSTTTGTDGLAKATLTTGGDSTARNITVTAKAASFTSTVTVSVGAAPSATPVNALTLQSSAPQIPSDGSSNATIVAIARDANNLLMAGVPVAFTSTSGGLAITQGITDSNGQAIATLSTAGDSTPRNITVSASAGGKNATTVVAVA